MSGVVAAFVALVSVAVLGYLVGWGGLLRASDELVLSRLAFFVATPALMFATVSRADLGSLFSPVLLTQIVAVACVQLAYVLVARMIWRRDRRETTIGVLAASYVNAGNLGIPISIYVLGDGALVAPILLFQILVLTPVSFLVLDKGARSVRAALLLPLRNPLTVASLLGLAFALTGTSLPVTFMRPIELLGGAAVPVALLAYGLSLYGSHRAPATPGEGGVGKEVFLVIALKSFAQPGIAYLTARLALGLEGGDLLAATLFAALPTAQNIYVYAVTYDTGRRLARSAVLLTTGLSIPIMTAIGAALG
ncbi:AEC family transporter [Nonomuraea sp. KC401]|uniref:AEC family transporter n=1 Tax=unclassified Nonomuraea TaxID=2593643 RepID=UPI0010FDC989|nr:MULTISPECIES: AEC family transporter [unclassified Nonomuraea]NBE94343.1 AEC family transporter [Nonomuraea sp. K271]TLF73124.1 AEC family transporter [Nonomuraea sp. KC401]